MQLLYITWDVKPEIFEIGNFAIRWYGFLFALGFLIGYFIIKKMFTKEAINLKLLDSLTTYMVVSTIVGARLGHCLFYEPDIYLANPIDILKIWEGGLASHGAAIGILFALWLFSRKSKQPFVWIIDRIVVVVALAGMFIRLGNLMNSEIFGNITELPWGFIFVRAGNPALAIDPRHPTQIYEALSYLLIFIYLLWHYNRKGGKPVPGYLFAMFLILVFGMRFLIEFVKEPQVQFEATMTLNMGQLLSIPFVLFGVGMLIYQKLRK